MGEIDIVFATKATKVRDKTISWGHAIIMESPTLPFRETEGNLEFHLSKITRSKLRGSFNSVQIILKSASFVKKHRAGHSLKIDLRLELIFEGCLTQTQSRLFFQQVLEDWGVAVRFHHMFGRKTWKRILGIVRSCHGG